MFVRRSLAALTAAALLAVGVPTVVAGPASAEPGSGALSTGNGVIYAKGCMEQPVPYNVALPAGTTNWSLQIDTIAPDGTAGPTQRITSPAGAPVGAAALSFCYFRPSGDYTLKGTLTVRQGFPNPEFVTALAPSTFTMRAAKSKTKLRAKTKQPRVGKPVKFSTKSRQEEQTGYFGTYAEVVLQTKRKGKWVTLGRTRTRTDPAGKATIVAKVTKGSKKVKVRAVTAQSNDYDKSASKSIKIRPKRR